MNKFIFIGNLTKDPEMTVTSTGKARTTINLAVNRRYVKEGGEREADFFLVVCYGNTAENAAKYLAKGKKCCVMGEVRTGKYKKDGKDVYTTEYRADEVEFLSPGNGGKQAADEHPQAGNETQVAHTAQAEEKFTPVQEDDLPF